MSSTRHHLAAVHSPARSRSASPSQGVGGTVEPGGADHGLLGRRRGSTVGRCRPDAVGGRPAPTPAGRRAAAARPYGCRRGPPTPGSPGDVHRVVPVLRQPPPFPAAAGVQHHHVPRGRCRRPRPPRPAPTPAPPGTGPPLGARRDRAPPRLLPRAGVDRHHRQPVVGQLIGQVGAIIDHAGEHRRRPVPVGGGPGHLGEGVELQRRIAAPGEPERRRAEHAEQRQARAEPDPPAPTPAPRRLPGRAARSRRPRRPRRPCSGYARPARPRRGPARPGVARVRPDNRGPGDSRRPRQVARARSPPPPGATTGGGPP